MKTFNLKQLIDTLDNLYHNQNMKQIYQTPIRQLILEHFAANHHPSSLDQIQQFLLSKDLKCEFSTIFRQVKNMVKDGLLKEFFLENKSKMYELIDNHNHLHYHILCTNCNKVSCGDLLDEKFEEIKNILNPQNLGKITELELKIKGICKRCN